MCAVRTGTLPPLSPTPPTPSPPLDPAGRTLPDILSPPWGLGGAMAKHLRRHFAAPCKAARPVIALGAQQAGTHRDTERDTETHRGTERHSEPGGWWGPDPDTKRGGGGGGPRTPRMFGT